MTFFITIMNSWEISSFMKVEVQKNFFLLMQTYFRVLKTMWTSFVRDSMFLTSMRLKLWQMKRITIEMRLTHGHVVLLMHGAKSIIYSHDLQLETCIKLTSCNCATNLKTFFL
jgi:hypothetical protein